MPHKKGGGLWKVQSVDLNVGDGLASKGQGQGDLGKCVSFLINFCSESKARKKVGRKPL